MHRIVKPWDNLTKWKKNAICENKIDKDILKSVIKVEAVAVNTYLTE